MHYYRLVDQTGTSRLVVDDGDEQYDLTAVKPSLRSFTDLARASVATDAGINAIAEPLLTDAPTLDGTSVPQWTVPVNATEVWAAGVTYEISEQARQDESGMPEVYVDVYDSKRPELFFKATPSRTVGPGDYIGVRSDSNWNVPEPELAVVLHHGEIVGYTIGNDVSSREIEGANPLYLPQAKVYDRCCAIGPCIASPDRIGDVHDLEITMTITRDEETVYDGTTSTSKMARTCEELVSYYTNHNSVPETAVLMTGTSLVPEDEFTLCPDDIVSITIDGIGTLENPVMAV